MSTKCAIQVSGASSESSKRKIGIVYHPIGALKLDPNNPRQHPKKQIRQLAASIAAFGFVTPVGVDANLKVIIGHGRVLAGRHLGLAEVPTVCLDHLTEAQAKAYGLADNKLQESAIWDAPLLSKQFQDLAGADIEFDLEITGFETTEIDLLLEGTSSAASEKKRDVADEVPGPSGHPLVSCAGDLWALDKHFLFCGNALDAKSYATLLKGEKAAAVFIDPPFNLKIEGCVSGLGKVKHKDFAMAVGEMTEAEFISFLTQTCTLLSKHSVNGAMSFICMDWRHAFELLSAGRSIYELKNICIWNKDRGGMGSFYRGQHEMVFVYKNGTAKSRNNVQLGRYGRDRTNVWSFPSANSTSKSSEEGNLLHDHPTPKPVALVAEAILDVTARGDIVLDTFLGSGTTLMAAERTRRICYGMELEPMFVDTSIRRWQKLTGQAARHVATGRTFAEMGARKGGANVKKR